jgi:putative membrane protein
VLATKMMILRAMIAVSCLALSSCRGEGARLTSEPYEQTSSTAGSTTTDESLGLTNAPAAQQLALSNGDREFIESAVQCGRFEIESSRLALERLTSARTREFAAAMIEDSVQANKELEGLLRDKGVSVSSALNRDQSQALDRLRQVDGPAFDREYHDDQVKAHDDAIALFERAEHACDDANLRSFASAALPTLRKHRAGLDQVLGANTGRG